MKNPRLITEVIKGATYLVPVYKVENGGLYDAGEFELKFCKGNKDDATILRQEGFFTETLLQVALEYLQSVNVGDLASRDTSIAITHIEDALLRLGKRAEDRKIREVQGTYQK